MPTIEKIFTEYIHLDGDTQPRTKIDQAVCDEYGERMKAGEKFPPIDVFFDGEYYWLADGFHRVQAYVMAAPGEAIECNVYLGTQQDAQWHSYSVNKTHGLRRTNEDKERAVQLALAHPAAEGKSNVQIAEHCGVSEFLIRKCRKRLTSIKSKSDGSVPQSRPRKGRDGRIINTARIGKTKRTKAPWRMSGNEYYTAKQEGIKVHHLDSIVKLELPNNHVANCAYDLLRHFAFDYLQEVFVEIVRLNQER